MEEKSFWKDGYCVIRKIYNVQDHRVRCLKAHPPKFVDMSLHSYLKEESASMTCDLQVPGAPFFCDDRECMKVHQRLCPIIGNIVNRQLLPTYCYGRLYNQGSILKPHTDRSACQISASLCVGTDSGKGWLFWLVNLQGEKKSLDLSPGDAVLYMGNLIHWREPADETVQNQTQLFFHYVEDSWPSSDCVGDVTIVGNCMCCKEFITEYPLRACFGCRRLQCAACSELCPKKNFHLLFPNIACYEEEEPHVCFAAHLGGSHRMQVITDPEGFTKEAKEKYHVDMSLLQEQLTHHPRSVCQGCRRTPIIGTRFHCLDCGDDLCQSCISKNKHVEGHQFHEFPYPWVNSMPEPARFK